MNTKDKQKALFDLVSQVAAHLPREWRLNQLPLDEQRGPELIGEGGTKVYFRYRQDRKAMVNVTGSWPKIDGDSYYRSVRDWGVMGQDDHYPTMNFSLNRKPATIANDLKRRFLDDYTRLYFLCIEKRRLVLERRELIKHKVAAMKKVAPLFKSVHRDNPDNPCLYLQYIAQDAPGGEIYFNYQSTCDLKLNQIPFDTAIKVLAVIDQDVTKNKQDDL